MQIRIRVLGPVEVVSATGPIRLPRQQQRLILGILALHANTPISGERLMRLVRGHSAGSLAALHTRISELRQALHTAGPDGASPRIIRGPDGYALNAPPGSVDVNLFHGALERSRAADSDAGRVVALRDALSMWRGRVLGVTETSAELMVVVSALESLRLTAYEDLFETELSLGREREILEDLIGVSDAEPSRERLVAMRLTALRMAGRGAEALVYYDRWRRWLADELGVDPGEQVQEAYAALLRPGSDLAEAAKFEIATPHTLPPESPGFTGRTGEAAALESALTSGRAVAVSGPGGVGKTSLTLHVAHRMRDAFPDGQLYVDLRGGSGQYLAPGDVLGRFLHALGVSGPALSDDLDERTDLYRSLLAERRVLVVLDNAATAAQVVPLIPAGDGCGLIVNSRVRLGAALGVDSLDLDILSTAQAIELLSAIAGSSRVQREPEAAARLAGLCGFLPLALRVTAARLRAKPHWSIANLVDLLHDEQHRLDYLKHEHYDVRASIMVSYSGLTEPAQSLIRLMGGAGVHETTAWVASALLDTTDDVALGLLEELFDARLADASGQAGPLTRYRLHDLVYLFGADRAAAVDHPSTLHSARHRMNRVWLTAANVAFAAIWGSADFANTRGTTALWDLDAATRRAIEGAAMTWFETERSAIRQTIRQAVADGFVEVGWELASTACHLFEALRDYDMLTEVLELAHDATLRHGDLKGQAAMLFRMGHIAVDQTRYSDADRCYAGAAVIFQRLGDDHGLALTQAYHGHLIRESGRTDEATAMLQRVLEVPQADPPTRALAWRVLGQTRMSDGDLDGAERAIEAALDLVVSAGARTPEAQVRLWLGMLRLEQGRVGEARTSFTSAMELCQEIGDRTGQAICLHGVGLAQLAAGEREQARSTLSTALRLAVQPRPTHIEAFIRRSIGAAFGSPF